MLFETGELYHVYNQGNNREKIFFSRANYLLFLNKIKEHVLPHADILAWCLMPNHFHLMMYVHTLEIPKVPEDITGSTTFSRATSIDAIGSTAESRATNKKRNLNKSIGVLLTSYTRAINFQEGRTGSLFKPHTKAECITKLQGAIPAFYNTAFGAQINVRISEKEYPQVCFNYIHDNPTNSRLCKRNEDWEFSSYRDYYRFRNGKLINRDRISDFGIKL
jgi:putative transposase